MSEEKEMNNLLYNITWLRKKEKLSKKEMARILGIGKVSINKIEKGEVPKRLVANAIIAIYQNFGISPAVLFEKRLDGKVN